MENLLITAKQIVGLAVDVAFLALIAGGAAFFWSMVLA